MVGTPHADESSNVDIPLQSRPRPSPRSSTPVPDDSRGNYPTPAAPVHSTAAVMLHDNSSIHTLVDDTPPPTRIKDPDDVEAVKNFNSRPSIEFAPTEDDPRLWSDMKKNLVLGIVAGSSMCGIIAGEIYRCSLFSLVAHVLSLGREHLLSRYHQPASGSRRERYSRCWLVHSPFRRWWKY